jgi:hypothetical protein
MNALMAAKTQSVFREVNERIESVGMEDSTSVSPAKLSLDAYEEIRRMPTHFVVAPGISHLFQDVERIFERHSRHWVLEKFGEAGLAASKLDPRSRPRPS